jgi:hypothetical protein
MQFDLSTDELTVLAEVVDGALRATREEIYKAEVADYKRALKQREAVLVQLQHRLVAPRARVR